MTDDQGSSKAQTQNRGWCQLSLRTVVFKIMAWPPLTRNILPLLLQLSQSKDSYPHLGYLQFNFKFKSVVPSLNHVLIWTSDHVHNFVSSVKTWFVTGFFFKTRVSFHTTPFKRLKNCSYVTCLKMDLAMHKINNIVFPQCTTGSSTCTWWGSQNTDKGL